MKTESGKISINEHFSCFIIVPFYMTSKE